MEQLVTDLEMINWSLILPLIIIQLILMVIALIDWVRQEETNGPKMLWLVIIILVNVLGPILYFIFGRRNT